MNLFGTQGIWGVYREDKNGYCKGELIGIEPKIIFEGKNYVIATDDGCKKINEYIDQCQKNNVKPIDVRPGKIIEMLKEYGEI